MGFRSSKGRPRVRLLNPRLALRLFPLASFSHQSRSFFFFFSFRYFHPGVWHLLEVRNLWEVWIWFGHQMRWAGCCPRDFPRKSPSSLRRRFNKEVTSKAILAGEPREHLRKIQETTGCLMTHVSPSLVPQPFLESSKAVCGFLPRGGRGVRRAFISATALRWGSQPCLWRGSRITSSPPAH